MSDKILSLIYDFSKKFSDPKTNLAFDPKNNNISAIIKKGNVNIFLQVIQFHDYNVHTSTNQSV